MKRARIADLDVVLTGGVDREGGGTGPLIVLLHGFGAPGDDLVPFHRVMNVPRETRFAFPAAPLELDMMPGARAWWHIDMMRMQDAIARGDMRDLSTEEPDGLGDARAKMDAFLTQIRKDLSPSKVVLGGFSQGSMLSMDVALRTSQALDAIVVLSGTLLARDVWVPKMSGLAGKPIFQSHGTHDPILPYALAERLKNELVTAGASVTFVPFRGQHEIPPPVLESLVTFLGGVLTKSA